MLSVATHQYLPKGIVLADSFIEYNPDCDVIILVPDISQSMIDSREWPFSSSIRLIGIDEINDTSLKKMHRYYNAFELCCSAKSFLLEYALFKVGYEKAVLLDPDIVCYATFEDVWTAMDKAAVALTPHIFSPLPDDGCLPDDREIVNAGFVNGGFWAAIRSDTTKKILDWMKNKVIHFGFFIPERNLYADQTWMSCLPWFFPQHVLLLRNQGMNVAYWNLHERRLTNRNGVFFSEAERLVFFHFSGYDDNQPARLTTHTLRNLSGENAAVISMLLDDYRKELYHCVGSLPHVKLDHPCSNMPLSKRLKTYESFFGDKPEFMSRYEAGSMLPRLIAAVIAAGKGKGQ